MFDLKMPIHTEIYETQNWKQCQIATSPQKVTSLHENMPHDAQIIKVIQMDAGIYSSKLLCY